MRRYGYGELRFMSIYSERRHLDKIERRDRQRDEDGSDDGLHCTVAHWEEFYKQREGRGQLHEPPGWQQRVSQEEPACLSSPTADVAHRPPRVHISHDAEQKKVLLGALRRVTATRQIPIRARARASDGPLLS